MTTPIQDVLTLRNIYITEIMKVFEDNSIKSIEFEAVENDFDFNPGSLNRKGILTSYDEYGNDFDANIKDLSTEAIAILLTQIRLKQFEEEYDTSKGNPHSMDIDY